MKGYGLSVHLYFYKIRRNKREKKMVFPESDIETFDKMFRASFLTNYTYYN